MGSFGAVLRRTREEKGISIDEIAGETRLSKRYLLALEDEAIHKLPGGTYNRAYLRSYAGYLGLDTERLVREYSLEEAHQTETGRLQPQPDILTSIGKAVESRQTTTGAQRSWSVTWKMPGDPQGRIAIFIGVGSLAILLLVAALWLGLRTFGGDGESADAIVSGDSAPAIAAAPPDRVAALPSDEVPEPPQPKPQDAPAAATSEAGSAVSSPAPVAPKPVDPAPTTAPPVSAPRAPVTAPPPKPRATARAARPPRLSVTGSGVGTGVVDRRLVGESDTFEVGTRVTFWTRIAGGRSGDAINHVWFHNGVRIGTTTLRVASADWRTQSRQLLTPEGQWAVEARDAEGRVLVRHRFRSAPR